MKAKHLKLGDMIYAFEGKVVEVKSLRRVGDKIHIESWYFPGENCPTVISCAVDPDKEFSVFWKKEND